MSTLSDEEKLAQLEAIATQMDQAGHIAANLVGELITDTLANDEDDKLGYVISNLEELIGYAQSALADARALQPEETTTNE